MKFQPSSLYNLSSFHLTLFSFMVLPQAQPFACSTCGLTATQKRQRTLLYYLRCTLKVHIEGAHWLAHKIKLCKLVSDPFPATSFYFPERWFCGTAAVKLVLSWKRDSNERSKSSHSLTESSRIRDSERKSEKCQNHFGYRTGKGRCTPSTRWRRQRRRLSDSRTHSLSGSFLTHTQNL